MNSIVKFPTPPEIEPLEDLPINFNDLLVQQLMTQADKFVAFDINTADIEQLQLNTRISIINAYQDFKRFESMAKLIRHCLARYRREQLHKYLESGKSDSVAAAKALAYNRAFKMIPKHINSYFTIRGQ